MWSVFNLAHMPALLYARLIVCRLAVAKAVYVEPCLYADLGIDGYDGLRPGYIEVCAETLYTDLGMHGYQGLWSYLTKCVKFADHDKVRYKL